MLRESSILLPTPGIATTIPLKRGNQNAIIDGRHISTFFSENGGRRIEHKGIFSPWRGRIYRFGECKVTKRKDLGNIQAGSTATV